MKDLQEIVRSLPDRLIAWGKFMKFLDSLPPNEREALWEVLDNYYFTVGTVLLIEKELGLQLAKEKRVR